MNTEAGDAHWWCEERLRNPEEDLYYARLFSPSGVRSSVTAIAAIYIELEAMAAGAGDAGVARTKLAWWHEEFARLAAGRPAHPATRLLAADGVRPAASLLPDLVAGTELNLLAGPAHDLASAGMRAERGFARLVKLLGLWLEPDCAEDYAPLGKALGLARMLTGAIASDTRAAVAVAARDGLMTARPILTASPPAIRVLAALGWRRALRPETADSTRRAGRGRVFVAWRAARGKLPRALRTTPGA